METLTAMEPNLCISEYEVPGSAICRKKKEKKEIHYLQVEGNENI